MRAVHVSMLAGLVTAVPLVAAVAVTAPAAASTTLCGRYDTAFAGHRYVVQNNVWGATTAQCLAVNGNGFAITRAEHRNPTDGPPASYPSIFYGCHYGTCSPHTILPLRVDSPRFTRLHTAVTMAHPASGTWDAAYDLWFDPAARRDGQNTGAELMVWLNHRGGIQPAGVDVGTVHLAGATWQVWHADVGWQVVTYVRETPTDSIRFPVADFYGDAVERGYAQPSWYLTSVQAGFETWVGGTGLAVRSFSVDIGPAGGSGGPDGPGGPDGRKRPRVAA